MNPIVSIITPLYNTEKYVAETIESVLAQTYMHWELIIVDDGSTDKSVEIANNYAAKDSRIKVYRRNRLPKGGSACRNIGIEKSNGDYIIFLDSDDLLHSNCFENRVKTIGNQNLDFAVFQIDAFAPSGKTPGRLLTKESNNYLYSFLSHDLTWSTTGPLWCSKFLKDKLIGFDERYLRLQDPEFHTRALLIDNVKFTVYSDLQYLDCSYRVDYKKPNLLLFLQGVQLYLDTFIEKIQGRKDKEECLVALGHFFGNMYSYYATSSHEDKKMTMKEIKQLNRFFISNKLISKDVFRKAEIFLFCVKNNLFQNRIFSSILRKLGFRNFYGYRV